jgi:hypothetical protein
MSAPSSADAPVSATCSSTRIDVVPTATTRRPSRRAAERRDHTAASRANDSLCSVTASSGPSGNGLKVPRPTCSVTLSTSMPAAASAASRAGVKWSPAVGAAAEPSAHEYVVWYRSGSSSGVVMYGGSGVTPA